MLSKVAIDEIKASEAGRELIAHLQECADELRLIDDINPHNPTACAVQVEGRKEALITVKKMLEPLLYSNQSSSNKIEATASRAGLIDML